MLRVRTAAGRHLVSHGRLVHEVVEAKAGEMYAYVDCAARDARAEG